MDAENTQPTGTPEPTINQATDDDAPEKETIEQASVPGVAPGTPDPRVRHINDPRQRTPR